jgi:hypothetical protein
MSNGMFAPRPTKSDRSLLLLARFTGSSLASSASTTRTVYRPLAAVQVPRLTGLVVAPAAMAPVYEPVSVRTTAPLAAFTTVSVMPCAPPADATVPWFLIATVNVTTLPLAGLPGVQPTGEATRSELATGATTSEDGLVKELFVSFCSMTALASSTLALSG